MAQPHQGLQTWALSPLSPPLPPPVQVLREVGKQDEEEKEEEDIIILTVLLLVLVGRAPVNTSLRCDTIRPKALVRLLLLVVVGGETRYAHAMAGLDHRATTAQQHSNTACGVRRMMMMLRWLVGFLGLSELCVGRRSDAW